MEGDSNMEVRYIQTSTTKCAPENNGCNNEVTKCAPENNGCNNDVV